MASSLPEIICIEKQRLIRAFLETVTELNALLVTQSFAMPEASCGVSLEDQIADATIARDNAKYAVLAHREAHGC